MKLPKINLKNLTKITNLNEKFSNLFVLIGKEIRSNLTSTGFYVILAITLLIQYFVLFILGGFSAFMYSDLTMYFSYFPILFPIIIPAFTMSSILTEFKEGTDEFILSKPVGILEFILSKFISAIVLILILLILQIVVLFAILPFGNFDYGLIFSQYLATILLASSLISFGIFVSSISKSQISSFLISFFGSVFILLFGSEIITRNLPLSLAPYIERLSLYTHFANSLKGLITIQDLLYFSGFISFFLVLTFLKIKSDKLAGSRADISKLRIISIFCIVLIIVISGFGQKIPGKFDTTRNKVNSLSKESKAILRKLPENITIEIFYSPDLPANAQTARREVVRLLKDYQNSNPEKLQILYKSTSNPDNENEALEKGIQIQQYGQQGKNILEFSSITGYLGIAINYKDQTEIIPYINISELSNLEYEITSLIRKLTNQERKTIGILDSFTKHNSTQGLQILKELLSREYNVTSIVINEDDPNNLILDENLDVLVINTPNQEIPDNIKKSIREFLDKGKGIFLMVDPVDVQMLEASLNQYSYYDFFDDLGIRVENALLLDAQSNIIINYPDSSSRVRYPFFPVLFSEKDASPIVSKLETLSFRWGSWISVDNDKSQNYDIARLFTTSKYGFFQKEESYNIDPNTTYDPEQIDFDVLTGAISFSNKNNPSSRVVLVADGDFISDQEISYQGQIFEVQNVSFALSSVEWLAQDETLAGIKAKDRIAPPVVYPSGFYVQLIVFVFAPLNIILVVIIALVVKIFRNRKMKEIYCIDKLK